jgi:hypothetical protein
LKTAFAKANPTKKNEEMTMNGFPNDITRRMDALNRRTFLQRSAAGVGRRRWRRS